MTNESHEVKGIPEEAFFAAIERQENAIKREEHAYKMMKTALFISISLIGIFIAVFIFYMSNSRQMLANTIREFTYINHSMAFQELDIPAQRDVHSKLCLRIFTADGFVYDRNDIRALSPDEKVKFITTSFDISYDLKKLGSDVSPYMGITAAVFESSLNPLQEGPYGEKGLHQWKWATLQIAYDTYKRMPEWFCKKYPLEINSHEDIFNPYISTVLYYIYIADLLKRYRGSELWAFSEFHWGLSFLGKGHKDGEGDLPAFITLNGIKYCIPAYAMNMIGMREAYETGNIRLGQEFKRKWTEERERIIKEEVTLNNATKTINKLRKEKKDAINSLKEAEEKILAWNSKEEEAYESLRKIYGEVQAGNYTNVRSVMNTHIPIIKNWMRKYEEANMKNKNKLFDTVLLVAISSTTIILILIITIIIKLLRRIPLRFTIMKRIAKKINTHNNS